MKLVFCVTLSLILSCFNVNSGAVDVVKQIDKSNEDGYKTKLTDLISDCKILILERLDFDDLVNAAQIHEEFSTSAAAVFRREYSHKIFWIYAGFLFPNNTNELLNVAGMAFDAGRIAEKNAHFIPATVQLSKEYIKLEYGDQILNLFKHFGHLIKKIKFQSRWVGVGSELIGHLINKYSSESLVDLSVNFSVKSLLNYITKPWINVENLKLLFEDTNENRIPVGLNERFPSLRRLYLWASVKIRGFAYFSYLIPHLEHIEINGNEYETFEGLIHNNPQIRSFAFNGPIRYTQKTLDILPQLETLALRNFELGSERIRKENVTTLTISYPYKISNSEANLEFPHLQTFHIDKYRSQHCAKHHAFLKELNYLRHLHLTYIDMTDSEFKQLTENLTNLAELTIKGGDSPWSNSVLSASAITEFVRSHDTVQQLKVIHSSKYPELQEQLKLDWDLKINGDELSFQRKIK